MTTDHQQKIKAALQLLSEDSTTFTKFENIRTLLRDINPQIDKTIDQCSKVLRDIKHLSEGDLIELSAENLPETTKEQEKRKKLILFFVNLWNDLRSEVKRANDLYQQANSDGKITKEEQISLLRKLTTFSKGPFGITTLIAATATLCFLYLNNTFVPLTIINLGCEPITPPQELINTLPGLKSNFPIVDADSTTITLPPIEVVVDNTSKNSLTLSFLQFKFVYNLPSNVSETTFNGQTLLGKQTTINLAEAKNPQVVIKCSTS